MKTSTPARTATPTTRSSASPRPTPARGFSGEQLMINYNSALKVVNLGEPEASLILRKPRSPQGQGGAEPPAPPACRTSAGPGGKAPSIRPTGPFSIGSAKRQRRLRRRPEPRSSPPIATRPVTSRPGPATATSARSGTPSSSVRSPGYPHELVVDLGAPRRVEGLLYVPRQDSPNGRVKDFEIRVSDDGKTWSAPVATGRWNNDPSFKHVALPGSPRALCPAPRPERGRRPAVHERGRAVDRLSALLRTIRPRADSSSPSRRQTPSPLPR